MTRDPVVMLTALTDVSSRVRALEVEADGFLSKRFHESELLARVKNSALNKRLSDCLEDTEGILFALTSVIEIKDRCTDNHLKRMAQFSERTASVLGLSSPMQRAVRCGGSLHDIGKVGISDAILRKPACLTSEEYAILKEHPVLGASIVRPMRFGPQAAPVVRGHHERWDGCGYPDGLASEAVPMGARIVALCGSFGAMTSDRSYSQGLDR